MRLPTIPPLPPSSAVEVKILRSASEEQKNSIPPILWVRASFFLSELKKEIQRIKNRIGRSQYPYPNKFFKKSYDHNPTFPPRPNPESIKNVASTKNSTAIIPWSVSSCKYVKIPSDDDSSFLSSGCFFFLPICTNCNTK